MTPLQVAELIEGYALRVEQMRGPSSRTPHGHSDDKLTLVDEMRGHARALRTQPRRVDVGTFRSGPRVIGGRRVEVESRSAAVRRRRA